MSRRYRINQDIIGDILTAIQSAKLEGCAIDVVHQKAFHLYLQTWVVGPLVRAFAKIHGEDAAVSKALGRVPTAFYAAELRWLRADVQALVDELPQDAGPRADAVRQRLAQLNKELGHIQGD